MGQKKKKTTNLKEAANNETLLEKRIKDHAQREALQKATDLEEWFTARDLATALGTDIVNAAGLANALKNKGHLSRALKDGTTLYRVSAKGRGLVTGDEISQFWDITISGYGTIYAEGTETQAEEFRAHKASQEAGIGRKTAIKDSDIPEGVECRDLSKLLGDESEDDEG